MSRIVRRSVAVLVAVAVCAGTSPVAVAADGLESGLWYFDRGHVQDAFDAGFSGEGVTVAVIDSQINPEVPTLVGANLDVVETSYCFDESGSPVPPISKDYEDADHATSVVALIAGTGESASGRPKTKGVAPNALVRFYAASQVVPGGDGTEVACLDESGSRTGFEAVAQAMSDAIDDGADIISISQSGYPDTSMGAQIARAHAMGIVVVGGLPNDSGAGMWPAAANGVVAVQAFDEKGEIQTRTPVEGVEPIPNTSEHVVVAAPGIGILVPGTVESWDAEELADGTSLATPITSGFLAVVKSKYPDATGNQLIRTLIHSTGGQVDSDLDWGSDMGYGAVSLTAMLQLDPGEYPDENPLLEDDPIALPSLEDIENARLAEEDAQPAPTVQPDAPADDGASWLPWAIGGGTVGLLVIAGIVILIVVMTRSSRGPQDR